jgi:hypothetical protein
VTRERKASKTWMERARRVNKGLKPRVRKEGHSYMLENRTHLKDRPNSVGTVQDDEENEDYQSSDSDSIIFEGQRSVPRLEHQGLSEQDIVLPSIEGQDDNLFEEPGSVNSYDTDDSGDIANWGDQQSLRDFVNVREEQELNVLNDGDYNERNALTEGYEDDAYADGVHNDVQDTVHGQKPCSKRFRDRDYSQRPDLAAGFQHNKHGEQVTLQDFKSGQREQRGFTNPRNGKHNHVHWRTRGFEKTSQQEQQQQPIPCPQRSSEEPEGRRVFVCRNGVWIPAYRFEGGECVSEDSIQRGEQEGVAGRQVFMYENETWVPAYI